MHIRVLDLDGAIPRQETLLNRFQPFVHDLRTWGPRIRLGCRFRRFARFEKSLTGILGNEEKSEPVLTLYGSGDFHHVSLALLRRQRCPFNLLVLDNHPDWMRAIPFLHCGTGCTTPRACRRCSRSITSAATWILTIPSGGLLPGHCFDPAE